VQHGGSYEQCKEAMRTAFYPDDVEWQVALRQSALQMIQSLKFG